MPRFLLLTLLVLGPFVSSTAQTVPMTEEFEQNLGSAMEFIEGLESESAQEVVKYYIDKYSENSLEFSLFDRANAGLPRELILGASRLTEGGTIGLLFDQDLSAVNMRRQLFIQLVYSKTMEGVLEFLSSEGNENHRDTFARGGRDILNGSICEHSLFFFATDMYGQAKALREADQFLDQGMPKHQVEVEAFQAMRNVLERRVAGETLDEDYINAAFIMMAKYNSYFEHDVANLMFELALEADSYEEFLQLFYENVDLLLALELDRPI